MARKATRRTYVLTHVEEEIEYELCPEAVVIQRNTKWLIPLIDPALMCPFLQCLTPEDRQYIAARNSNVGPMRATKDLLDRLVRRNNFWNDFLCALKDENIGLEYVSERLEKDMKQYLEEKECEKNDRDIKSSESPIGQKDAVNKNDGEPIAKIRKLTDEPSTSNSEERAEESNRTTIIHVESDRSEDLPVMAKNFSKLRIECIELPEMIMKPRKYQEALAQLAKEGHNTIICAPTGSGKTFVASLICGSHLEKMYARTKQHWNEGEGKMTQEIIEERKDVKIVVIVPRHAILLQWYREFKQMFPTYKIAKRSGSEQQSNVPLDIKIQYHDVIIMTAELFKNALVDDKIIEISAVTLLVFDECHHTMEDHPYNMIMAEYHRVKLRSPNVKLPQIVGLSASPGAGRKTTYADAKKRILNLCANLDTKYFVTVPEELQKELEKYSPKPTLEKTIAGRRMENPFTSQLYKNMMSIENFAEMHQIYEHERGRPEYRAKMEKELETARKEDNERKRKCGEHLLEYNKALELINLVQLKDGLKLLDTFYCSLKERQTNGVLDETEEYLLKTFADVTEKLQQYSDNENEYPNPKLQELRNGIVQYNGTCKQRNDEFRGIIFVPTKLLAEALKTFLTEDPELNETNPMLFISANRSVDGARMTKSDQDATLEDFKDGKVKLLISTSILDEGVHIEACNMIVNYNRLTDAITMLQSRGRARKENSTEVWIGDEEVVEKNEVNLILIEKMEDAIKNIQKLQETDRLSYKRQVEGIQREAVRRRETKMQETALLQNSNSADAVAFRCKGCTGNIVCKASDIRVIEGSSFVNPHPGFREKVMFCDHTDQLKKEQGIQKIYCAQCKTDWGNTADGHPCLKIKSFVILVDGKVKKVKQWKHIPCKIKPHDGYTHMDTSMIQN